VGDKSPAWSSQTLAALVSLTDGVIGVHVSKHVFVLRANNFDTMFYDCKLICVDTGNRI